MNETPRTDGKTFNILPIDDKHYSTDYCPDGSGRFVLAKDARQLDRELAAVTAQRDMASMARDDYRRRCKGLEIELAAVTRERDAAKDEVECLKRELGSFKQRAWSAESMLETRYGLRREIAEALGVSAETGDDALRVGLEAIRKKDAELKEAVECLRWWAEGDVDDMEPDMFDRIAALLADHSPDAGNMVDHSGEGKGGA